MEKTSFKERLHEQIEKITELMGLPRFCPDFKAWNGETLRLIEQIWGKSSSHYEEFSDIKYSLWVVTLSTPDSEHQLAYFDGLETAKKTLESFLRDLPTTDSVPTQDINHVKWLQNLFEKFEIIARQLRRRHAGRDTLIINDEYDVQDLLHALLKLKFNDVRPEEWTPSYAGGASKMDFLLKDFGIVIETKKSRDGLREKEIGEQLIIDIRKYQVHPDCKTLVCFVYDPESILSNPYVLETDLSKKYEGVDAYVYVYPK